MFTGIVREIGTVRAVEDAGSARRLTIEAPETVAACADGDSVAVSGVCLTVVRRFEDAFAVEIVPSTLGRTTLGRAGVGTRVNLERALAAGDALGGHIVQGHVDGTGRVEAIERDRDSVLVDVRVPGDVFGVTVLHGSITLDGVSLTVNALPAPGVVQVSLIPYTLGHTTLGERKPGDDVNVEADALARLVAEQTRRWLEAREAVGS